MGALRRTLAADVAATPKCSSRAFSASARRFEESNSSAPSAPAPANPDSRKARTANALSQISRLGANRRTVQPGGLARGKFPSGQTEGQPGRGPPRVRPEGSLNITREASGPEGARRGAPPPGAMVRAPAQLKLSRNNGPRTGGNASIGGRRGPNLRGRDGKPGGPGNRSSGGPKRRERGGKEGGEQRADASSIKFENTLSDGMLQHLLRLQRGQWDRKPYEPKYAPGSFAANQLIHQGRELFRGEAPPVKIWGRLEKTIGVVGMHNAEAHLKVRRVTGLDDESLGDRREHFETSDGGFQVKAKASEASKASAVKGHTTRAPAAKAPAPKVAAPNPPAAVAQAAAAEVPAPKQAPVVQ
ncbi:hypothetical protein E8E12_011340 [Didymella heteroderae]|uniref:Uncharacterized protein n=1 Tax=Didymella heteroderae TaxID=1769908 RepID=A0A9P4X0T2_9PLEO|nr:hypothetical protein E8E12_011340 [Didymella heteroderae]